MNLDLVAQVNIDPFGLDHQVGELHFVDQPLWLIERRYEFD